MRTIAQHALPLGMALLISLAAGCGKSPSDPAVAEPVSSTAGDHSGWWCVEHGVPEEICGLCDSKLAADLQRKGDWCGDHDRPDSQCFACHPELEARFAAQYEAKYGTKPPKPKS
jgi:cobalt-zinc-cadmium efflux system membrane fusion protein